MIMDLVNPRGLCQLFIEVRDLEAAKAFYEQVFGWQTAPADLREMVVIEVPADCPFGIALVPKSPNSMANAPVNSLRAVFSVDQPEPVLKRCAEKGGQASGPIRYPGYGQMWEIQDPDGIIWGLFKKI